MLVLIGVLAGVVALASFVRLERRGRPEVAVGLLVGIAFVEMLLYPNQNDLQSGILRLDIAGQSLRLYEIVIALALVARVAVRGAPRWYSPEGIAWAVFLTWYATSFVVGLLHDNPDDLALFHAKAVVYLGGGLVLAAGVPVEHYLRRRTLAFWVVSLGVVAALYAAPTMAASDEPRSDESGLSIGILGADTATAMVSVAVVALMVEAARTRGRRPHVFVAGLGLLLVPFLVDQRAAIIGLATCVVILLALSAGRTWRRRLSITSVEAGLLLAALAVPVVVMFMGRNMVATDDVDASTVEIPLLDRVNESFSAESKASSAQTRKNLWSDAIDRIGERPLVGSGLGTEYQVEREAVDDDLVGGGFHNVLLDVTVRSGVAGLVLFLIAGTMTLATGVRVWRRHPDPLAAALAMGVLVALAGLMTKGMVESILEKYRLTVLMGVGLGMLAATSASERLCRSEAAQEAAHGR